jgi:hypothetical protein
VPRSAVPPRMTNLSIGFLRYGCSPPVLLILF